MTDLTVTEARDTLADVVNRVAFKGERVVLRRHGKAVAALVSAEDLELLAALEDQIDLKLARKALTEAARKGSKPWAKVKADLGL